MRGLNARDAAARPPRSRLTAEWRAWLAENLALGCRPAALGRILREAGVPPAWERAELEAAAAHPALVAARRRTARRAGLEQWLDVRSRLHGQSRARHTLEQRDALPPAEFFERYYACNRPVVLKGLMADWPALGNWSPRSFAERFGDERVEVMVGREADPDHDLRPEHHREELRLREAVERMGARGPTNDIYLVARNALLQRPAFRPLLEELRAPAGIIAPDLSTDACLHVWLGPAGTFSGLHHDHLNVLFCQVHGRKRFWLIPPFDMPCVYNRRWLLSDVDVRAPDLERYPAFAQVSVREVVLGPGDALFLPVGWWHAVLALDASISVSFVSFTLPGQNTHWRDCWLGSPPEKGSP